MKNIAQMTNKNRPNPAEIVKGWAFLFLVFASVLMAGNTCAYAGIHWVSANGSAIWAGCQNTVAPTTLANVSANSTLYCSLYTANINARAGDTVYIRGGLYNGQLLSFTSVSGTAANPITFSAFNPAFLSGGTPASKATFENAFPNPPNSQTEPGYGDNIFNWLVTQHYVDSSYGTVIVNLTLSKTNFENAFPFPPSPNTEPSYGDNIFSWLQTNNYLDNNGYVIANLSSSPVLTALQNQFTDSAGEEYQTILGILQQALAVKNAINAEFTDSGESATILGILQQAQYENIKMMSQFIPNRSMESASWPACTVSDAGSACVNGAVVSQSSNEAWDGIYSTKFTTTQTGQGIESGIFNMANNEVSILACVYSNQSLVHVHVINGSGSGTAYDADVTLYPNLWTCFSTAYTPVGAGPSANILFTAPASVPAGTWYVDDVRIESYYGIISIVGQSYLRFLGFNMSDISGGFGMQAGSSYNEIADSTLTNVDGYSPGVITGPNGNQLPAAASQYNWIHDDAFHDNGYITEYQNPYGTPGCIEDGDQLRLGETNIDDMSSYNLVENNFFYHTGHDHMLVSTPHNTIRNNVFHDENWDPNHFASVTKYNFEDAFPNPPNGQTEPYYGDAIFAWLQGTVTAATFVNAFPSPPSPNTEPAYGENIFNWLNNNGYVSSTGNILVSLSSSPFLTALQSNFTDTGESSTILNLMQQALLGFGYVDVEGHVHAYLGVQIASGGSGYSVGDEPLIYAAPAYGGYVTVTSVGAGGAITGINPTLTIAGDGYTVGGPYTLGGGSGGATINIVNVLQSQFTDPTETSGGLTEYQTVLSLLKDYNACGLGLYAPTSAAFNAIFTGSLGEGQASGFGNDIYNWLTNTQSTPASYVNSTTGQTTNDLISPGGFLSSPTILGALQAEFTDQSQLNPSATGLPGEYGTILSVLNVNYLGARNLLLQQPESSPDNNSGYNLVEGNRLGNAGTPITQGANDIENATDGNIIRYNYLFAADAAGIEWKPPVGGTNHLSSYNHIYNNTFYANGGGASITVNAGKQGALAFNCGGGNIANPVGNIITNNILYDNIVLSSGANSPYAGDCGSLSTFVGFPNTVTNSNDYTNNPKFTNPDLSNPYSPTLPDLSLQPGSPEIAQGLPLTTVASGDTGSGILLAVSDGLFFQDGSWAPPGHLQPDWITVEDNNNFYNVQLAAPGSGALVNITGVTPGYIMYANTAAAGSGYQVNEVLTINGGTGGQVVVASVNGSGAITNISFTNRGSGYLTGTETVTGAEGSGATVSIIAGALSAVSITNGNGGTGYHLNDVLLLMQTGGSLGTVEVTGISGGGSSGPVTTVSVLTPGNGYSVASSLPTVSTVINTFTTPNTVSLASPITRNVGDNIWLYKNSSGQQVFYGVAPDIGASVVSANPSYTLTASSSGNGYAGISGTNVTACTSGLNGASQCSASVSVGTPVTLTATPADSNTAFAGWTITGSDIGDGENPCTGTTTPCTLNISYNTTVVANFVPIYQLTATVSPTANGSVSCVITGGSIPCGTFVSNTVPLNSGTSVTLTAQAASAPANTSYTFTGWTVTKNGIADTVDCTGTGSCTVTVNAAATNVQANFITVYKLTVNASPSSYGAVTSASPTINCGAGGTTPPCSFNVNSGTTVTFTETPANSSYVLSSWSVTGGTVVSGCTTGTTCTVSVNAVTAVTANFTQPYQNVVFQILGSGTVTCGNFVGLPGSITCPSQEPTNSTVTFYANVPKPTAVNWSIDNGNPPAGVVGADCAGSTGTCTLYISAATSIRALFEYNNDYNLEWGANPSAGGTVTCFNGFTGLSCVSPIASDEYVTITAAPASGYVFSGWTVAGGSIGTCKTTPVTTNPNTYQCQVEASANTTVTANFTSTTGAPTPQIVQSMAGVNSGGSTSASTTFSSTTAAGNTIVAAVTWEGNTASLYSVTDTAGDAFILSPPTFATNTGMHYTAINSQIAYATNITAHAGNVVTAHFSGSVNAKTDITEITPAVLDLSAESIGTSTGPTAGIATTSYNGEFAITTAVQDNGNGGANYFTANTVNGWTLLPNSNLGVGGAADSGSEYQVQSTAGSLTGTLTGSVSGPWAASMATFVPASLGAQAAPINGSCGTANQNYPYGTSSFGANTLCSIGTANQSPAFPSPGNSTSWVCQGYNGGDNTSCAASQLPATYYVDYNYTGSTKSGTQANPWQHRSDINWTTIQTALNSSNVTIYFNSRGVWNDNQYLTIGATGDNYIFSVSGVSTIPTTGAIYTAPCGYALGCTYTVTSTNISGGSGTITTTGTGVPTSTSGALALQSGSGQSSITFSAMTYYTLTIDGHSYYDCTSSCTTTNWQLETVSSNRAVLTTPTTPSTTTLTIGTGTQTLTVGTGLTINTGATYDIINSSSNYMAGTVTSYNSGTGVLVVNVTTVVGSGTYSSWTVAGQSGGTIYINNDNSTHVFNVSGVTTVPNTSLGAYPIYYYDDTGQPVEGYPNLTVSALSISGGSGTITTNYAGDSEPTASGQINKQYIFTVSGVTTTPTPGAVYTSGSQNFTVIGTAISGGAGTITTSGTGDLSSSGPGTLTEYSLPAQGVGQSSISFSSVTNIGNGDGTINYSSFTQPNGSNNTITSNITITGIEVLYGNSGCIVLSRVQPTEYVNNITINNVVLSTPVNQHGIYGGYLELGAYNITIENSTIENTIDEGIYIGHYDYLSPNITGVVIQNNTLYDIGVGQNGTASVNLKPDDQGAIVRNNIIYRDSGSAGSGCGIFAADSNVQIYNNMIYNIQNSDLSVCGGHGIFINSGGDGVGNGFPVSGDLIYNNLIFNNEGAAISINASAPYTPNEAGITGLIVDNNTMWGNDYGIETSATAQAITISQMENNIIGDNTTYNIYGQPGSGTTTFSNVNDNLYYGGTGSLWHYNGSSTWAAWQAQGFDANGFENSNPSFVNSGSGNYQLSTGSPAIGQGANLSARFTVDLAGNARPATGNWDIGAYVYIPSANVAPAITSQPSNQTVAVPATATFTLTASGNPAPTYQWQQSTNGGGTWTAISGATNASYTTPATVAGNNGTQFECVVTNTAGTATSNAVTLTVDYAPSITSQPSSAAVTAPATATFTVAATGNPAPGYQWQQSVDGGNTWTAISGATSASYITPATSFSNSGTEFECVVTNTAGTVTSNAATLTVNTAPSITGQPSSETVTAPATATFSITATGNPTPSYQWRQSINSGGTWTAISGATNTSYTTPATVVGNNGTQFECVVTNAAGTATSNAATLTVDTVPAITSQPSSAAVTAPATATFTVAATGSPAPGYQWQQSTNGGGSWTAISGAISASYTTPATSLSNSGTEFECVVTNTAGTVTSNAATLTVNTAPSITGQPSSETVTAPATATFTIIATGTPAPSYQWKQSTNSGGSWTTISGATNASYTTPATVVGNNGTQFECVVTNVAGTATGNAATLTVDTVPAITSQPSSTAVTAPATATFTVAATGSPAPGYQWQQSADGGNTWTAISGATSASYITPATSLSNSGTEFECVVTNTAGTVTSNTVTLTVNTVPAVTSQPSNQAVVAPATATFTLAATGNPTPSYQWKQSTDNGTTWTSISGATSSSYTTPATSLSDSGTEFECVLTNTVGTVTSSMVTLTVSPTPIAPSITSQPGSAAVTAPATATFAVTATGTPTPTYQWQQSTNGGGSWTAISGAISASYTTSATSFSNSGTEYECVVTNTAGTVTSNAATLTVNTAPSITSQPSSAAVTAPATATFTVAATGTPTPTYQWQQSTNGGGSWTAISGATSASYTTPATSLSNSGTEYECVVTNTAGTAISNAATLTVNTAPSITSQPSSTAVTAPATATFTVAATGNPSPGYQWQQSTNSGGSWTTISGATSASYTTPATSLSNSGTEYECVVTNTAGTVTSNAVTLTVNTAPSITSQPSNAVVTAPATATFTVVATGTPTPSYQWQQSTNSGGTWTAISGATSASYITPATSTSNNGTEYECVVTNTAGTVTSNAAALTVDYTPNISSQPVNQTVVAPATATFTVVATGNPAPAYQWQQSTNSGGSWTTISGATSVSYITPATSLSNSGTEFECVVTNTAGTVTSNAATLTVNVVPAITSQPDNETVTAPAAATFTVAATGTPAPSYQWKQSTDNGATWTLISGATSALYNTPATLDENSGTQYECVVSNIAGTVTSNAVTLTVDYEPTITSEPSNKTVIAPASATFTVAATGNPTPTYQWQQSADGGNTWTPISGATGAAYAVTPTTVDLSGNEYECVVTNGIGFPVTSNAATLTVYLAPSITAQPASQTVDAGQTATFGVSATGTAPLNYQWQKNGVAISGATTSSYTTPSTADSDDQSTYSVVVSNMATSTTSTAAILTVNYSPIITVQPADQIVTTPATATFSVVVQGTAPLSYQWQENGTAISGATSASYTTPVTALTDSGAQFECQVTNVSGSVTSNLATLTVSPVAVATTSSTTTPATQTIYAPGGVTTVGMTPSTTNVAPSITTQPSDQTVDVGQAATFSVSALGTAPLTYQWQQNGAAISGATNASYTTPATAATDDGSNFTVVVTNATGNITSSAAVLTVNADPPTITTQPVSRTVDQGQSASFSVTAAGSKPLSYQWQKNGVDIPKANDTSYTVPGAGIGDNGSRYSVTVTNPVSSVNSYVAALTVNIVPPAITNQPADQTVSTGKTATFSVIASGTSPLAYQWQENGNDIPGATSNTYATQPLVAADNDSSYTVVVSNAAGNVTSNAVLLTVTAASNSTDQPLNQAGHGEANNKMWAH